MAGDNESRTEDPTDKRKSESREKGQIAKSADLVSWGVLLIGITILQSTVVRGGRFLMGLVHQWPALIAEPDVSTAMHFMTTSVTKAFIVIAPLGMMFMILGVAGHVLQVKFVLAWKAMKPDVKRINPISGLKRMFSKHAYVELFKQILKLVVLSFIAYKTLWGTMSEFAASGPFDVGTLIAITVSALMSFIKLVALAGVVIGAADYLYQRKKTSGDMKMTKDEVKQENKQSEGSPEVKNKIRQKQRAMSTNRMMASIKDADVIVVNPIHIAVALKYDVQKGAPRVVAKGAGFVAEKIREKADENKVPILQDIPLARTLHKTTEIGDEIPLELFEAVAKVLAFIFGLRNRGQANGFHKMPGTPDLAEYERDEARKAAEAERAAGAGVPRNVLDLVGS